MRLACAALFAACVTASCGYELFPEPPTCNLSSPTNFGTDCEGRQMAVTVTIVTAGTTDLDSIAADLLVPCRALAGVEASPIAGNDVDTASTVCAAAASKVAEALAPGGVSWPPVTCDFGSAAQLDCETACEGGATCDADQIAARCPAPAGGCSASCGGACTDLEDGSVACAGACAGACTGACDGTPIVSGACAGVCSGQCAGACTPQSTPASCAALCGGSCSVDLESPLCPEPLAAPGCGSCGSCSDLCRARALQTAACRVVGSVGLTSAAQPSAELAGRLAQVHFACARVRHQVEALASMNESGLGFATDLPAECMAPFVGAVNAFTDSAEELAAACDQFDSAVGAAL